MGSSRSASSLDLEEDREIESTRGSWVETTENIDSSARRPASYISPSTVMSYPSANEVHEYVTPRASESSSSIQIPEPKDGFFGYSEEMNFQQVMLAVNMTLSMDLMIAHTDS